MVDKKTKTKNKAKKTLKQTNKQNKRQKQATMFVGIAQNGNFKRRNNLLRLYLFLYSSSIKLN